MRMRVGVPPVAAASPRILAPPLHETFSPLPTGRGKVQEPPPREPAAPGSPEVPPRFERGRGWGSTRAGSAARSGRNAAGPRDCRALDAEHLIPLPPRRYISKLTKRAALCNSSILPLPAP